MYFDSKQVAVRRLLLFYDNVVASIIKTNMEKKYVKIILIGHILDYGYCFLYYSFVYPLWPLLSGI